MEKDPLRSPLNGDLIIGTLVHEPCESSGLTVNHTNRSTGTTLTCLWHIPPLLYRFSSNFPGISRRIAQRNHTSLFTVDSMMRGSDRFYANEFHAWPLFLFSNNDDRSERNVPVQPLDIAVMHPNTTGGYSAADRIGPVRTVDPVRVSARPRHVETHPAGT
jgi:hypothetical protein